jgi:hypothetical protein
MRWYFENGNWYYRSAIGLNCMVLKGRLVAERPTWFIYRVEGGKLVLLGDRPNQNAAKAYAEHRHVFGTQLTLG